MNVLESHSITNPQNTTDICAKFTIDDVTMPFILNDITKVNDEYTFSLWLKSETPSSVRVYDKVFASSAEWQKYSMTFKANNTKLNIYFMDVGTYYIYHPKLEIGNTVTDWTPAPEDFKVSVNTLGTRVTNAEASIESNKDAIDLRATKTEVSDAFNEYRKESTSNLEVTADSIRMEVSEQLTELNDADSELMRLYNELRMNYDFTSEGQFIGKKNSDTVMKLTNAMLQILISGNAVTTLDNYGLSADMANIEVLRIGDYSLTKSADGHLQII